MEMRSMKLFRNYLVEDESGQGLVEYALLASLIAIVAIVAMGAVGVEIRGIFESVTEALAGAGD